MGTWTNSDGLHIKFGVDRTVAGKAGEYVTPGAMREVETVFELANLTESETVLDDNTFIPAGVRIHEVEVITETAAATGTAIDLGLIRTDRSTQLDYDGLLAAFPTSQMNGAGERTIFTAITTVPATQTGTGALIGTTLANTGYLTCSRTDSTAFTAGKIRVKIRYYKP